MSCIRRPKLLYMLGVKPSLVNQLTHDQCEPPKRLSQLSVRRRFIRHDSRNEPHRALSYVWPNKLEASPIAYWPSVSPSTYCIRGRCGVLLVLAFLVLAGKVHKDGKLTRDPR
jgi:hypothetical protein